MEAILGADNVEVEQTVLAPKAALGWFRWATMVALLSLALFFTRQVSGYPLLLTGLSLVCTLLVNITIVFEYYLYREFTEPFFTKEKSQNVIGHIRRQNETAEQIKHLLIISGHHDSAIQFNWITYLGSFYLVVPMITAISSLFCMIGVGAEFFSLLFFGNSLPWVQPFMVWTSTFLVSLSSLFTFFFLGPQKNGGTVPGAADNLSACAITLAVGRILARRPELVPPNTEIRLITFGSEEAFTRGSSRYVERHLE